MYSFIEKRACELAPVLTRHRRNLHQIPETGWNEKETCSYIAAELRQLGYEVLLGGPVTGHETGIIASLSCGNGPVSVLRFDIDALPTEEDSTHAHLPAREHFCSRNPGAMHACGHDGHIAIGLGCARIFTELSSRLSGTIRLIFQPAEEGCKGAGAIVERGWLDDASLFLAGHIVGREYTGGGHADVIPGVNASLATTKFDAIFSGHSCHGAAPENGASVISAMASAVLALNGIPRHSEGATFLNIGRIQGGQGRNIVADRGLIVLEVRGTTTALNQYMEDQAFRIIQESARMYGCESEIQVIGRAPSLDSTPALCGRILSLCRDHLPSIQAFGTSAAFRASEDASLMLERTKSHGGQGAFLLFPTDTTAPLHNSSYDFDESILPKAATVFTAAVYQFCGRKPQALSRHRSESV